MTARVLSLRTRRVIVPIVDGRLDLALVDESYASDPRLMFKVGERCTHEGREYVVTDVDGTVVTLSEVDTSDEGQVTP